MLLIEDELIDLEWEYKEEAKDSMHYSYTTTFNNETFTIKHSLTGFSVFNSSKFSGLIYCLDTLDDAKRFVEYIIENEMK